MAAAMFPAPANPTIIGVKRMRAARGSQVVHWRVSPAYRDRRATPAYDWLKKPFSTRRACSSAETSTLRGVSRKVLSATFCIPPSIA